MTVPFLDFKRQMGELRGEVERAVARVLDSGWFILGEEVRAFEAEFAAYCRAEHAVGVANGTDAIALILRGLGIEPGDRVALPPNTAVPTASAVGMAGGVPTFVDVDPSTLNLSPEALERYLSKGCRKDRRGVLRDRRDGARVRAVIAVHLYGRPAAVGALAAICRAARLPMVEDACQAAGTSLGGRKAGTFGAAAAFSFYPTKNLGTYGDGGMVATGDAKLAERVRRARMYGFKDGVRLDGTGVNSRLDELHAAILREKLPRLEGWNRRRRELAARYRQGLAGLSLGIPDDPPDSEPNYHLFVVRVRGRDRFREALKAAGVGTMVHYALAIHRQKPYADPLLRGGELGVAERACREVVSLPLNEFMSEAEVDEVCRAVRAALGKERGNRV